MTTTSPPRRSYATGTLPPLLIADALMAFAKLVVQINGTR